MKARWMLLLSVIAVAGAAPRALQAQESQSVAISLSIPELEGFARHRSQAAAENGARPAARPVNGGELESLPRGAVSTSGPTVDSSQAMVEVAAFVTDAPVTRSCSAGCSPAPAAVVTISSGAPAPAADDAVPTVRVVVAS